LSNKENYFQITDAFIEGNGYLRYPQRRAYKRLKETFDENKDAHKIVVLATGSGKTGVMAIAPFKISKGRVLIITPSLIIREGISDEFDTRTDFNFWTDKKVILDENNLPIVYRYAGYNSASDKKRVIKYLEESDIVIANIHKVYNNNSKKQLINLVNSDFFDMIIVDEAHHSAADSWIKTFEYFNAEKIIKLTATPYRADEKELGGEIVYTYDLGDAIKDNVVKNIVSEDYTTQKLEFEIDGEIIDKETALERMDKNWVTRSVAYSDICSREIVKMSVDRLKEKRKLGGAHHQIIAVACSIKHAKQIMDIYNEYDLKANYVASDRPEESEKVIIEYKKGSIDVLVNVDMLSEGFDHPNISIAAIFRPFRTLSPYAQFIGRALRKITGKQVIDNIDNIAHVIYHKELDLDELWEYYTGEKESADKKIIIERDLSRESDIKKRDTGKVLSEGEIIGSIKTYLKDNVDDTYFKSVYKRVDEMNSETENEIAKMRKANMSEEMIEEFRAFRKRKQDQEIDEKRRKLREELIREELNEIYKNDIVNRVAKLYEDLDIEPKGTELPKNSNNTYFKNSKTNDEYIMRYINYNVKRQLKRAKDEWETYDYKKAEELVPILLDKIKEKIERIRNDE
jgi:DNA repair protein RadD